MCLCCLAQRKSCATYNVTCPHTCAHSFEEHVDTLIIDVLILPFASKFDIEAYGRSMRRRHSSWTCEGLDIPLMFFNLRRWIPAATSQNSMSLARWITWCGSAEAYSTDQCILGHLRHTLCSDTAQFRKGLSLLWKWIQLLQSNDVTPYHYEHEQIGLMAKRFIRNGEAIDCGPSFTRRIGARSRDSVPLGVRWSTTEGYYLGGGPSLLNHACIQHANALIEYDHDDVVLAIEDIDMSSPIRIVYDDCVPLFATRQISCGACAGKKYIYFLLLKITHYVAF